ncbi:hypothetical protein BT96DRAFT_181447 [Gymnopus androsaceus JB14]|uniref:Uncharacterized protein n=1 Tax=Gymnopus androsaceus JB14 TaxID=1447944 RepID=A0A6A4HA56_9AGAR|nr:hypothetical protein BT96DRAFT_181447 [Gymnopus androsaceus JB14]
MHMLNRINHESRLLFSSSFISYAALPAQKPTNTPYPMSALSLPQPKPRKLPPLHKWSPQCSATQTSLTLILFSSSMRLWLSGIMISVLFSKSF